MYESSFRLNTDFLGELWRRLRKEEEELSRQLSGVAPAPDSMIPSPGDLRTLIEGAFWTGMTKEEGHASSFVLVFAEPEPGDSSFIFQKPVEFAPDDLARLAAAVHHSDARIGAWHGPTGSLAVWGYTSLEIGAVELTVIEAGQVLVTFGGENLAAVFGTRAVFIDGSCLLPGSSLWSKPFPHDAAVATSDRTRERKIESVLEVARSMRWHGRGGTLLLVPPGGDWRASVQEPVSYEPTRHFPRARETFNRVDQVATLLASPSASAAPRDWRAVLAERFHRPAREHQESLRSIARLTAVDGATVMTSDLEVAGFGAKIRAVDADARPETVLVREPVDGASVEELPIATLGNTRHQSAAQFVHDQRGALAVVASQDRTVTMMTWDDERGAVLAIRHAELVLL